MEVSQLVHLLDEFHLLFQEVVLQEVTEMSVCVGRTQGLQSQKGLLQGHGGFHGILSFTPLILGWLLHILEEGTAANTLVLHLQEMLGALILILGQLVAEVTHTLQATSLSWSQKSREG